jgi:hypothetical protein
MADPKDFSGPLKELMKEPYANQRQIDKILRQVGKGEGTTGSLPQDISAKVREYMLGNLLDLGEGLSRFKETKDTGRLLKDVLGTAAEFVPPGRLARALAKQFGKAWLTIRKGQGRAVDDAFTKEERAAGIRDFRRFNEQSKIPGKDESIVKLDDVIDLIDHYRLRRDKAEGMGDPLFPSTDPSGVMTPLLQDMHDFMQQEDLTPEDLEGLLSDLDNIEGPPTGLTDFTQEDYDRWAAISEDNLNQEDPPLNNIIEFPGKSPKEPPKP